MANGEIIPSELDLFKDSPELLAITDYYYEKIPCKTALSSTDFPPSLEFSSSIDRIRYTDLNGARLCLTCKYLKSDGSNLSASPEMAPVQNTLHSMFKSVDMWLNNVKITPPEQNMPYISWLQNLMQSHSSNESELELAGWYPNEEYKTLKQANQSDPTEKGNDKY